MLTGRISVERVSARCRVGTEALRARLRLAHLFQSADIAPRSVPPHAILLVRRAAVRDHVSLASFRLPPRWEQEAREVLVGLYRRAVRPVRGQIPAGAEAVLFEDIGEWLACLGLAVRARTVERAWYWRASLRGEDAVSSSLALARVWAGEPRYVPAAVKRLAEWGRATDVLQLFSPQESSLVWRALAEEWGLAEHESRTTDATPVSAAASALPPTDAPTSAGVASRAGELYQRVSGAHAAATNERPGIGPAASGESNPPAKPKAPAGLKPEPPWRRWLPAAETACERLPLQTQRLLAVAAALSHRPAYARSAGFAREVGRWLRRVAERSATAPQQSQQTLIRSAPRKVYDEAGASAPANPSSLTARDARGISPRAPSSERRVSVPGGEPEVSAAVEALQDEEAARATAEIEEERQLSWRDLDGCRTQVGGVLFLLNLLQQTGLPECFDQELSLSEHVSGWGLAEMLGKALLGPLNETFGGDPLWPILALLDGRAVGEMPAAKLPDVDAYRIPPRWLERFDDGEQSWKARGAFGRLRLWHRSGDFIIVDRPLEAGGVDERAAIELERYRAQGINARLDESIGAAPPSALDAAGGTEAAAPEDSRAARPGGIAWRFIPEWPRLSRSLRGWMRWTFPFLRHLLTRTLGAEARTGDGLARLLLVKPGTLYCSATHLDLVMSMEQITLPVRRAGLDTNPGWVRDLMRVVSFHFE